MRDEESTFGEAVAKWQERLKVTLEIAGLDQATVHAAVESGYFALETRNAFAASRGEQSNPYLVIRDSFYGRKTSGHIALKTFIEYAHTRELTPSPASPPSHRVSSLADAEKVLSAPHHARYREAGRM